MAVQYTPGMGELTEAKGAHQSAPFGHALADLADERDDIVGLTADMAKYTDILPFAERHPRRFFDVGMAEQNLIAVAAGMAKAGKIPYVTTYGVFLTRRALDFIAIACAHSHAPVKIFASMPGLANGLGGTHQSIEDIAIMRTVPGISIIDPCDATELGQVVRSAAEIPGTVFVRNIRGNVPVVLDESEHAFVPGKAALLKDGSDVGIVSTGTMSGRALDLVREAKTRGVSAGVLHVASLKPFDSNAVVEFCGRFPRLVILENHVAAGGLGSLVTETLYRRALFRPIVHVALEDQYHECGPLEYLEQRYGFDRPRLMRAVMMGE